MAPGIEELFVLAALATHLSLARNDPPVPCDPISEGLSTSQIATLHCSSPLSPGRRPTRVNSLCEVRCKYRNRLRQFFCWSDGWDFQPQDMFCEVPCKHPGAVYPGLEWSCSESVGEDWKYRPGVLCDTSCREDQYQLECGYDSGWIVVSDSSPEPCHCKDPGPDWSCQVVGDGEGLVPGTTCSNKCHEGLKIECLGNGTWDHASDPGPCLCDDPTEVYDDVFWECTSNNHFTLGDKCSRVCATDNLTSEILCSDEGLWIVEEGDPPRPCQCTPPATFWPYLEWTCGGTYSASSKAPVGTKCTSICKSTQETYEIECKAIGSWEVKDHADPQACPCGNPCKEYDFGYWACSHQLSDFQCAKPGARQCASQKIYSKRQVLFCGKSMAKTLFQAEDTCVHWCPFSLDTMRIVCQSNGTWAPLNDLGFRECSCPDPQTVYAGFTGGLQCNGSTCTATCADSSSFQIECQHNGIWNITRGCTCPSASSVYEGIAWECSRNEAGGKFGLITCKGRCQGNLLTDVSRIKCSYSGYWVQQGNVIPLPCSCRETLNGGVIANGQMFCEHPAPEQYLCVLECDYGYVPTPTDIFKCSAKRGVLEVSNQTARCERPVAVILGGLSPSNDLLSDAEVYSTTEPCSLTLPSLNPGFKADFAVWFKGTIVVCGDYPPPQVPCHHLVRGMDGDLEWKEYLEVRPKGKKWYSQLIRGHLQFFGGKNQVQSISEVQDYDGMNQKFGPLNSTLANVSEHCAVSCPRQGLTYILGGYWDRESEPQTSRYMYRVDASDTWAVLADETLPGLVSPVCTCVDSAEFQGIVALDSQTQRLLVGTFDSLPSPDLSWRENTGRKLRPREGPAMAVLDGSIAVFGGNTLEVDKLEYDAGPERFRWAPMKLKVEKARKYPAVVAVPASICRDL